MEIVRIGGHNLGFFSENGKVVYYCRRICAHRRFDHTIYFLIFAAIALMAAESPESEEFVRSALNFQLNFLLAIAFSVETILKCLADGFSFTPFAYLKDGWNRLDFLVVMIAWVDLALRINNKDFEPRKVAADGYADLSGTDGF